jgi:hypothetical protein
MKKYLLVILAGALVSSSIICVNGEITANVNVDENLFVTYEFKNLDQQVFDQSQLTPEKIPGIIASNLEKSNKTVLWSAAALEENATSRTIRNSFYLGGTAIVSSSVNRTTLRRVYEIKTGWRKFKVNITDSLPIDFASALAAPVADWQKTGATTFYYENTNTGTLDVLFYLALPESASGVRVQGDTVFYEAPPLLEDQLLGTPFLILIALAVILLIIVLYRKVR